MMAVHTHSCVVIGRFRCKDDMDFAIEELTALGFKVLAPDKGRPLEREWEGFLPLASEIGLSPGEVEDDFLRNITRADFVYIFNTDGYIGNTVSMELGFCIGLGKRIYAKEKLNPLRIDKDLRWAELNKSIEVLTFQEIAERELEISRQVEGVRPSSVER